MDDPRFITHLEESSREKTAPVVEAAKILQVRVLPNYFKEGFRLSIIIHLSLLMFAILGSAIRSLVFSPEDLKKLTEQEMKTAIRVDVLDLPNQKLSELQDVDLSKEAAPTQDIPEAEDDKDKMVLEKKEEEKKSEVANKASAKKRLEQLRDELRADAKRKALMDKLKKEQAGALKNKRQALAGNKLSEGYSLTGDVARDGDVHAGKVKNHLYRYWKVPGWMMSSKQFHTEIVVKLGPNGEVLSQSLRKSSGNSEYDQYAMEAIKAADPFPAPPESLRRIYLEEGMLCAFPE
ncbi:MAG: TonB C-terminal domain-containing protein [Proteobacteria bacterium]|nr:TonB C-terminal domain-containing protein [Pseudomonadota bacterium]